MEIKTYNYSTENTTFDSNCFEIGETKIDMNNILGVTFFRKLAPTESIRAFGIEKYLIRNLPVQTQQNNFTYVISLFLVI
jgi:hypothetical protein